jgi:hypothetical protein
VSPFLTVTTRDGAEKYGDAVTHHSTCYKEHMTYGIQRRINFVASKEPSDNMTAECALQKNVVFIQDNLP